MRMVHDKAPNCLNETKQADFGNFRKLNKIGNERMWSKLFAEKTGENDKSKLIYLPDLLWVRFDFGIVLE